jgi:glycosyltransferase involved in cell wall biosynthesis
MRLYPGSDKVKELVYSGRMPEAGQLLEQALKERESAAALNDLALVRAKTGPEQLALELIERAEKQPDADVRVKVNHYYLTELAKLDRSRGQNARERVIDLKCGDPGLKPKLSIIMRTYNRPEVIKFAIESVLGSQFQDWELVIVNDGGDHEVEKVIEGLWDKRMVYAYAQHSGNAGPLNVGLRLARGGLIGFLDDDDIIYPEHFQRVVSHMEAHPEIKAVYTDLKRVWLGPDGKVIKEKLNLNRDLQPGKPLGQIMNFLAFVIRRECLERVPGFLEDMKRAVDGEFALALREHFNFEYLPGVAGEFRFWRDLERISRGASKGKNKWINLTIYSYGVSPFYSFGPVRGGTSRRYLSALKGFLTEFPQMVEALELKKLHKRPEWWCFNYMAKMLEEDQLIKEARAAFKYSVFLAPYKIGPWKNLIRSRMK